MKQLSVLALAIVLALALMLQAGESPQAPAKSKDSTEARKAPDPEKEVIWYNYQDGWNKATKENKHMFVDFTATWCRWCKELDKKVFSQPEVIKRLNEDFVPVKVWQKDPDTVEIDGFRITMQDIIKREFRVSSYPQLWWVSPEGARVGPWKGYLPDTLLLDFLDVVQYYRYDSTRNEAGEKK